MQIREVFCKIDFEKLQPNETKISSWMITDRVLSIYFLTIWLAIRQVESNGTVLSTNWKEVGSKKVEGSPPEGMEVKKWEY